MPLADLVVYNVGVLVSFHKGPLGGWRARDPGAAGVVRGAGFAVRDGRIVEVGSSGWIRGRYDGRVVLDAGGRLVTPGLVDSHTHLLFSGYRADELVMKLEGRSYSEILEAGGGIYRTVRETRRAGVEELARAGLERLRLMAGLGTTVVEVKTGYGLLPEYELMMLEAIARLRVLAEEEGLPVRIVSTLLAHVVPEEYPGGREAYVRDFAFRLVPEAAGSPWRPEYVDVFCDRSAFTPGESRLILESGLRHGLRARIHAEELAYIGCSDLAGQLELDSADHLEYLPAGNARLLAERGTVATLLPSSMLAVFAEKKPPVGELRSAGAVLGLASDFNPNNMNPSLQNAMELAVYLLGLTPLEALAAATVNAAHSLRLEDHGRIAPGSAADFVVWDVEGVEWLGYLWGVNKALHVYARGVRVGGACSEPQQ